MKSPHQCGSVFSSTAASGLNMKVSFQQEDKARAQKLQEARLNSKRINQANLEARKGNDSFHQETTYQNKLMVKAARLDNYNKLCFLSN